jgi:hypothetical protein
VDWRDELPDPKRNKPTPAPRVTTSATAVRPKSHSALLGLRLGDMATAVGAELPSEKRVPHIEQNAADASRDAPQLLQYTIPPSGR